MTLSPNDAIMDEVVVAYVPGAARREEGAQRITPADMRRVPGPGTGDLASYLQTLPGVVTMGDRGGQVFIRGGTPSENMVLVDGAMIYQPSHIVGFFSPFPENLVADVNFYAGGFGPRYNGRISSVLDIQMRHGDRFNTIGSASISPFAGEILAEGPISEGNSSWLFSSRNSLIEQTSEWYPIREQPLKFQSQYIKTSVIDENSRCSASMMRTYDRGRMDFEEDESIIWRNLVFGGRCVALPEGSQTLMDMNINLSHFTNSVREAEPFGFSSNIMRINLDVNLRQYYREIRLNYGIYSRINYLNYDLGEKFVGFNDDAFTLFLAGGHLEATLPVGERLSLQPGAALTLYPGDFSPSIEPRFRFTWQPFGREQEELSGALGIYRQPVVGVNDMRDVSSVFVAWMSAPIDEVQMQALHALLGWQQTLTEGLNVSVEGFYKRLNNIPVPLWNTIARFNTELVLANGHVHGADLRLEYNRGPFYGMIGYGYSWTLYESRQDHFNIWFGEPIQEYHPPHDRRHQVNALVSLDIGSITAGVRWQLGTGMPFTRPMGFDDILDFRQRLPLVNQDRGTRRVILDRPYGGRLPTTHRLDISLERSFRLSQSGSELNLQMGAINSYDQTNLFYYDVYTHRRIDQLPFMPYATLKMEIR
ncbi:MAG: TonB-dependent receptor [Balneolaceae bacterium]